MNSINQTPSSALDYKKSQLPDFSQQGYSIERELGHNIGGGRVTYKVISHQTLQPVVIKQFQFAKTGANWSGYEALQREIELLQQLSHPSIPRYLGSFETDCGFCLVQEYKDALSLAQPRHFTPESIQQIALAVLEVLVYLQQRVPLVIHGDIKPENILVDEQLNVYLVDFGLARIGGEDLGASSTVKGTLGFMPPEVLFGRPLTKASDLYSLGATLICLLTQTPSTGIGNLIDDTYRINFKSLVPQIDSRLVSWLQKMVAPLPQHRYSNAAAAQGALQAINATNTATSARLQLRPAQFLFSFSLLSVIATICVSYRAAVESVNIKPANIISIAEQDSYRTPTATVDTIPHVVKLLETRSCKGCNLRGTDLRGIDLRSTDLEDADLTGADLRGSDLRGANLAGANLTAAKLSGANLTSIDLRGVTMPDGSIYQF